MTFWARGHVKWHGKLKTKYLLFCKTCGHQTCQSDDFWWGKLIHNVRWPSDYVITRRQVTNSKLNIPSSARSMTTKHGRLVTYYGRNPTVESHDPLTLWWCVVVWQIASLTYLLWKSPWPWSLEVGDLPRAERTHEAIYPLTTRSLEVTWQTKKKIIFPPEALWPPNFARCWH